MLSLQLKSGEYVTIGEEIAVQVFKQSGDSFHVAVKAPAKSLSCEGKFLSVQSVVPMVCTGGRHKVHLSSDIMPSVWKHGH